MMLAIGAAALAGFAWFMNRSRKSGEVGRLTSKEKIGIPNFKKFIETAKQYILDVNDEEMYVCYPYVYYKEEIGGGYSTNKKLGKGLRTLAKVYKDLKSVEEKQMIVEVKKGIDRKEGISIIHQIEKADLTENFPYFKKHHQSRLKMNEERARYSNKINSRLPKLTPFMAYVEERASDSNWTGDKKLKTYRENLNYYTEIRNKCENATQAKAFLIGSLITRFAKGYSLNSIKWEKSLADWIAAPHIIEYCKKKIAQIESREKE